MTQRIDPVGEIVATWHAELPDLAVLPMELSKRIARLAALIDAATQRELSRVGLTKAAYEVLAALRAAGPPYRRRQHALAHSLLLSSGGTTNVVHRLVTDGYVVREPHPDDRRGSTVRLTDAGRRRTEEAVRAVNAAQADLFAALDDGPARALADQLRDALLAVDPRGSDR